MLGCEEMPKGEKAKMMVLKDLLAQMQKLMSVGQGDEPMAPESLADEVAEDEGNEESGGLSSLLDEKPPMEPKKKKVSMMVVASGKSPMAKMNNKGGKRYG